jgi:hypothetical protein
MPFPPNQGTPPYRLLSLESLAEKCELIPFAFVRDAIDVWISIGRPGPDGFFGNYLRFVKEIFQKDIPIFKYEDFCTNPESVMKGICKLTGIPFHASFREYHRFRNVNGDVQTVSRGQQKRTITPLPRKIIPKPDILKIDQCRTMVMANEILGYPTSYHGVKREGQMGRLRRVMGNVLMKAGRVLERRDNRL